MSDQTVPSVAATVRLVKNNKPVYATDYGNVSPEPIMVTSLVPEDYVIKEGFPHAPDVSVRSFGYASTIGEYMTTDRPTQSSFENSFHTRFIPGDQFYDEVTGTWRPANTRGVSYYMRSAAGMQPEMVDIEYTRNREVITPLVLQYNYADYSISSFNSGMDVAPGNCTFYMVGVIQGVDKGCVLAFNNGIEITHDSSMYISTPNKKLKIPWKGSIQQAIPFTLIVRVEPPKLYVYLSSKGTKDLAMVSLDIGYDEWPMVMQIGKSYGRNPGYAQLALMEFGFLDYALKPVAPIKPITPVPVRQKYNLASNTGLLIADDNPDDTYDIDDGSPSESDPDDVDDDPDDDEYEQLDVGTFLTELSSIYGE